MTDNTAPDKPDEGEALQQIASAVDAVCQIVGSYYRHLSLLGVPDAVAGVLCVDLQNRLLSAPAQSGE